MYRTQNIFIFLIILLTNKNKELFLSYCLIPCTAFEYYYMTLTNYIELQNIQIFHTQVPIIDTHTSMYFYQTYTQPTATQHIQSKVQRPEIQECHQHHLI